MNSPSPLLNADDRFASAVNFCLVTKVQLYSIVSKGTLPETRNGILCRIRRIPQPLLLIVYNILQLGNLTRFYGYFPTLASKIPNRIDPNRYCKTCFCTSKRLLGKLTSSDGNEKDPSPILKKFP